MRGNNLPAAEIANVIAQIAAGLDVAHGQGIVHRDLKPDNIMITAEERVKILDFGLAKVYSEDSSPETEEDQTVELGITQPHSALGTPSYMSPEQATGDPVDHRSDIYSLGCILFELATGRPPYTGPTTRSLLARHATAPVPELEDRRAGCSAGSTGPDHEHSCSRQSGRRATRLQRTSWAS